MDNIRLTVPGGTSVINLNADPSDIAGKLPGQNVIFLTDENIYPLYQDLLNGYPLIVIPAGEQEKNPARAEYLYRELVRYRADRATWLVAFGGGVITDLAGFVATTFLRGMKLMFIPTSLLAMVDAAIGGKNGVNLGEYKNLIGTFRQPEQIIIIPEFLQTLPPEEFISGMAEVIKYGLIHDPVIIDLLSGRNPESLFSDRDLINKLIVRSVRSKVEIVEQDEADHGVRRILNFGHTFGHAVERIHNLSHGQAVAVGMCVAMEWSVRHDMLNVEIMDIACELLNRLGLIPHISPDPGKIVSAMEMDKKVRNGKWIYVLLESPGEPVVQNIDPKGYLAFLQDLAENTFYERLYGHR